MFCVVCFFQNLILASQLGHYFLSPPLLPTEFLGYDLTYSFFIKTCMNLLKSGTTWNNPKPSKLPENIKELTI